MLANLHREKAQLEAQLVEKTESSAQLTEQCEALSNDLQVIRYRAMKEKKCVCLRVPARLCACVCVFLHVCVPVSD